MGVSAKYLLSLYELRKSMQERGVTNPSDHVKEVTRTLVERLSECSETDEIDIKISGGTSQFINTNSGEVLAELHYNET